MKTYLAAIFFKFMPFSNYFPLDYDFQAGSFLTVQFF